MDNLLLRYKKNLEDELRVKLRIKSDQQEKLNYIKNILEELEKKFYDLNSGVIDFDDFLKFLYSIDNKYIYENVLHNLINSIKDYNQLSYEIFYLSNTLKKIINQKNTDILLKQGQIDKIQEVLDNISEDGDIINPLTSDMSKVLISESRCFKSDTLELMREISIKNNIAIRRKLSRKNAEEIRKLKQSEEKHLILVESVNEKAQEILKNAGNDMLTITEEESIFLDDLYNAGTIDEIEEILSLMNSDKSSLRLVLFGLNNHIKNREMVELYVKLYDKYRKKVFELEELNKKYEDELNKLLEQFNEIKLDIYDKEESIMDKLSDKQKIQLQSFYGMEIDSDSLDMINKTLNTVDLNVEFLLFYNEHINLKRKIDEFDFNSNNLDKVNYINSIINSYENYKCVQQNYIDSIDIIMETAENNYENNHENLLVYLTDEDGITYAEGQINNGEPFTPSEFGALNQLIIKLKRCNQTYIHTTARKVMPYEEDYRKKRLSTKNIRLIFLQLSNKYIDTNRSVYLVITAGKKNESKNAPIYKEANHLKRNVLEFVDKLNKMSKKEIEIFLEKQKDIENNLLEIINSKEVSVKK